ncbi:hypothetical protein BCR44DRAFT_1498668 [Catenaria anguillulae PL171]|uniref:Uncharacterized protein n=1 Tax=Catenaria anguillulae PL171 TaxID=765915 RepID=A0A1Y2HPH3_9FUNG|nr:hypothetical protein BCR44DRAFT_1498668 [Catenaria anguillulae PL171]
MCLADWVPSEWRYGVIYLTPKKADGYTGDVDAMRPITLLECASKLFNAVVWRRIQDVAVEKQVLRGARFSVLKEARVQLASHVYKLVPEPDMLIFAKAIRSGRKPAASVASFSLDSLVTFRVKVLTRRLPTLAQLQMYWPDRAPSPLCTLCGSLDDQQHLVVCPRLADERWELGVAAHKCVEQLLPGADTTLAVQARRGHTTFVPVLSLPQT